MNIANDNTRKFLALLWGGETACSFIGVKHGASFKNIPVNSVNQAIDIARSYEKKAVDIYMACAQFTTHEGRKATNASKANAFWLDIDCGQEKAASGRGYETKKVAWSALIDFCHKTGIPRPNGVVDSGNGLHVYWFLDESIPAGVWKLTAEKIKVLTHHYGLLADDSRTSDIASVLRFPGTVNRKNPENIKPVAIKRLTQTISALEILAGSDNAYSALNLPDIKAPDLRAGNIYGPVVESRIEEAGKDVAEKIIEKIKRNRPDLWAGEWRRKETDIFGSGYSSQSRGDYALCAFIAREAMRINIVDNELPNVVMSVFEQSGLYREEKRHTAINHTIPNAINETIAEKSSAVLQAEAIAQTEEGAELAEHEPGDIRAGRVFAKATGNKLLYVSGAGKWLVWDINRWAWSECGEEMAAAKRVAEKVLEWAATLFASDPNKYGKLLNFAKRLQMLPRLLAMVELAKSEPGMSVGSVAQLDKDPWLLGVRNGVVNLKDGGLLAPDPAMLITRQCGAEYDSNAECPKWLEFLYQIFDGDNETISFIQRAAGYTLTGITTEEAMFICFGHGANGKSVFSNVVSAIMGDYARAAPASLLTVRRADDAGPRNDLAMLCGARLVSINETQGGDRLDEQVVKQLAGREMISARFLHREYFDYMPTAKPWLRTNHKPIITGEDDGIWRRLNLIGFYRKFAEHERNPWLESQLLEERAGILAWMVQGCLEWQRVGLKPSPTVRHESATYRKESDLLGEFLDDTTESNPEAREEQGTLFNAYKRWHEDNGTRSGSKTSFTKKLAERGFGKAQSNGVRYYTGVKLTVRPFM